MPTGDVRRRRQFPRSDLLVGALLVLLGILFFRRALDRDHWSEWGAFDAQTLLSVRQWNEGGWLANHMLFNPQGYAPAMVLVDDEPLRHHAHGTHSGGIGNRRLYTHYPPGYLVPYAVLDLIGLRGKAAAQTWSLLLSLLGLGFFYRALALLIPNPAALIAVAVYAFSWSFWAYADSLANQPLDDAMRFGLMWASLTACASSGAGRTKWLRRTWLLLFLLTLASFDSVLFAYLWVVGSEARASRRFPWRLAAGFALAPLLAECLLLLQNASYLGFDAMIRDAATVTLDKAGVAADGSVSSRVMEQIRLLANHLEPFGGPFVLAAVVGVRELWRGVIAPGSTLQQGLSRGHLALLLVAGSAFPAVLPVAGGMAYQSRQLAPLAGAAAGDALWMLIAQARALRKGSGLLAGVAGLAALTLGALSLHHMRAAWEPATYDRSLLERVPDVGQSVKIAREFMAPLKSSYPPIFFSGGGVLWVADPDYDVRAPQIHPLVELYADSRPVLCVRDTATLSADLGYFLSHAQERFSPVLVMKDAAELKLAADDLARAGLTRAGWMRAVPAEGAILLDLSDAVPWERFPQAR